MNKVLVIIVIYLLRNECATDILIKVIHPHNLKCCDFCSYFLSRFEAHFNSVPRTKLLAALIIYKVTPQSHIAFQAFLCFGQSVSSAIKTQSTVQYQLFRLCIYF